MHCFYIIFMELHLELNKFGEKKIMCLTFIRTRKKLNL